MKTITFDVGTVELQIPDFLDTGYIQLIKENIDDFRIPCCGFNDRAFCDDISDCAKCVLDSNFTAKLWIKEN